jgi:catabolite regulation protein CreA
MNLSTFLLLKKLMIVKPINIKRKYQGFTSYSDVLMKGSNKKNITTAATAMIILTAIKI